jgi:HK97 family phage prohead protease
MTLRFEGHAALFDRVDRAGDVIRAGAFGAVATVPLLLAHRGAPVGAIEAIGEDGTGLHVVAHVDDPDLALLVRRGAVAGLSVGYRPLAVRQGARRELLRVALVEVSLVAVPMQPHARIARIF